MKQKTIELITTILMMQQLVNIIKITKKTDHGINLFFRLKQMSHMKNKYKKNFYFTFLMFVLS